MSDSLSDADKVREAIPAAMREALAFTPQC